VVSLSESQASCVDYCGYHNHINKTVFYAVEPYITCPGCNFGTILDSLTKVSSHELAEAVTDPALDAWWDPNTGDEIGDICQTTIPRESVGISCSPNGRTCDPLAWWTFPKSTRTPTTGARLRGALPRDNPNSTSGATRAEARRDGHLTDCRRLTPRG